MPSDRQDEDTCGENKQVVSPRVSGNPVVVGTGPGDPGGGGGGGGGYPQVPPFPPRIDPSAHEVRPKEVVLICLALMLLVCSILLFFKHWKKNYRDINQASLLLKMYVE